MKNIMTATIQKIDIYQVAREIREAWNNLPRLTPCEVVIGGGDCVSVESTRFFYFTEAGIEVFCSCEATTPDSYHEVELGTYQTIAEAIEAVDTYENTEDALEDDFPLSLEYDDEYTYEQYENDLDF
jgi:hypothetical protein